MSDIDKIIGEQVIKEKIEEEHKELASTQDEDVNIQNPSVRKIPDPIFNSHVGKQDRKVLPHEAVPIKGVLDKSGETGTNKNKQIKNLKKLLRIWRWIAAIGYIIILILIGFGNRLL